MPLRVHKRILIAFLLIGAIMISPLSTIHSLPKVRFDEINKVNNKSVAISEETNGTQNRNFSFIDLRNYLINDLLTIYGGFPLGSKGDEYINATYFGIKALYALGGWTSNVKKRFSENFTEYIYDGKHYGFRDWFGSNITLDATLWGLLLANFTGIYPSDFDLNSTINSLETLLSKSNINCLEASLLLKVMITYNIEELNASGEILHQSDIANSLLDFYSNGLFKDDYNDPILTTHLAIDAILEYNETIIDSRKAEAITSSILSFLQEVNISDNISAFGFGYEIPTVFDTGLAVDILTTLKTKIDNSTLRNNLNETFWTKILTFINNSQIDNGAVKTNPNAEKINIFQAYGATLAFVALQRINKYSITKDILPSYQIAVDDTRIINATLKVELFGTYLPYMQGKAEVVNLINNEMYNIDKNKIKFDPDTNIYKIILDTIEPKTFGNYILKVSLNKKVGITSLLVNTTLNFRIGYEVTVTLNGTVFNPGSTINVTASIAFHNGTYINNSRLILMLLRCANSSIILRDTLDLTTGRMSYLLNLSQRIDLGRYRLILVANDSYGYNHSSFSTTIGITDNINFTLRGNKTTYYPGYYLNLTLINVSYSSTNSSITKANITLKFVDSNGKLFWITNGTYASLNPVIIIINSTLPAKIPSSTNLSALLEVTWDNSTYGNHTITLFNATLKFDKFRISDIYLLNNSSSVPINSTNIYIGEKYNVSIGIIHEAPNATDTPLINATVRVYFAFNNTTFMAYTTNYTKTYLYKAEIYIDPNLPAGYNNFTVSIYLNFNDTWVNLTSHVLVRGMPIISSLKVPESITEDTEFLSAFKLLCNETNKTLANVSLIANISYESTNISVPISYNNDTYYLSFIVPSTKRLNITIFRALDKLKIKIISLEVKEKSEPLFSNFDPWTLLIVVPIICYVGYIYVRKQYSKKVSRRYLIEKSKKL